MVCAKATSSRRASTTSAASGSAGRQTSLNRRAACSTSWGSSSDESSLGGAENDEATDHRDADSLYRVLADEIVPCFYERNEQGLPAQWIARMRQAITELTPRFSTARMVREYTERFYMPAARGEL